MGWHGEDPYKGEASVVSLGSTWSERWCVWVGTGFGLGLVAPFAPGTFGSLPGVALALLMLGMPIWGQAILCAVMALLAVPICDVAERTLKKKDDGRISADEWMLYPIAVIGLPLLEHPWLILSTFLVIRFFDVLKLPPATQVQYLPGGWGIVADDFVAQIMALIANHAIWYGLGTNAALSLSFLKNANVFFIILPIAVGLIGAFFWEKKAHQNPGVTLPSWFSFSGRIGRKTFLFRNLTLFAITALTALVMIYGFGWEYEWIEGLLKFVDHGFPSPWYVHFPLILILLPVWFALLCSTVQRLHDLGYRGWWVLAENIPGIAHLVLLNLFCLEGEKEVNAYGLPPFKNETK